MKIDYLPYLRKKIGHDLAMAVGVSVLLVDPKARKVLLEKRADNGLFCLPGGSLDLGEKILDGARRELFEETGIEDCGKLSLFLVHSGTDTRIHYPNGDVTEYVDHVFLGYYDSSLYRERHDSESLFVGFFDFDSLPPQESFLPGNFLALSRYLAGKRDLAID